MAMGVNRLCLSAIAFTRRALTIQQTMKVIHQPRIKGLEIFLIMAMYYGIGVQSSTRKPDGSRT